MGNKKLLGVDLFSGAGGLSLGFLQTGQVKIVAAVENNESAQKTYIRNHNRYNDESDGRDIGYHKDIKKVNFRKIKEDWQNIDLVFGGPPCQGFSNANRQKSELISTNNQLVKEYVRAIKELEPDAFVMENVKAMKSDKHKFFYSSKDQKEIVEELGIELIPDKVILGKQNNLSDDLVCFLRNCIENNIDLSPFIINDKNLFSKISHISRKEKEAHVYIAKAQRALQKTLLKWKEQHNSYWSTAYEELWLKLGVLLSSKELADSSRNNLFSILNEIIEVQKVLMKMSEIQSNNIEIVDILLDHKHVCVSVQTYGVMNYLLSKFKSLGYVINEDHIINAAHFGAPQLRERLVLIGVKSEFVRDNCVTLPVSIIKDPDQFYKVQDAIGDLEEIEPFTALEADQPINVPLLKSCNPLLQYLRGTTSTIQNHVMTETTDTAMERFKVLAPGQNFHDLDESYKQTYSDPGRTQNTVYLRLDNQAPSGTVLNVRKSMWIHPRKNRAISIREAARLQTFPDDFTFEGSKDSQYQQIGNAVPPLLGRAVAEQVLNYLGRPVKDKLENIIKNHEIVLT
ncbi:DNA cytosine methyltransferase [Paenibacillus xerothermodurans]|uniref:DNA (cytosine-5-)-methyltransferase n=1 Tax=Paenibacillus xerothermodurans TaxID=1977292 RepID=A0A2W1NLL4_PAEXE|nr:DNA cytosine methyltransferase [Paenibacillus xerothermodurans]PZE20325.1 DNA cytosine methyltransferase [Paenibacillus xerothermodurans]